eukprot:scaffold6230_cov127-Isochrysis_galbana.AAC.12
MSACADSVRARAERVGAMPDARRPNAPPLAQQLRGRRGVEDSIRWRRYGRRDRVVSSEPHAACEGENCSALLLGEDVVQHARPGYTWHWPTRDRRWRAAKGHSMRR